MFGPDDIHVLDGVDAVRRRPTMYLARGVSAENVAEAIAHDALMLGARRILIERHLDWIVVGAETDWLRLPGRLGEIPPPEELFRRVVPFPEDGTNAMRHEILAMAFATDVVSSTVSERLIISGLVEATDPIWACLCRDGITRSVAFRGVSAPRSGGGHLPALRDRLDGRSQEE